MIDDKIYNSLLSPQELSGVVREDLNNGLIHSVFQIIGYTSKNDTNKIQTTLNEILHELDDRQKLINMSETYQNTNSVLDDFNTAFNDNFSDIYELAQIQHEIQSAKIPKSSLSNNFFDKIISLFKKVKNFFISAAAINKIKNKSQQTAEISKKYAENLELFKASIANTGQANLAKNVIDEMAYTYAEQQDIINFKKTNIDMSFYNKQTINAIKEINEKVTAEQQLELQQAMQNISMSIIDHQQHYEQQATNSASSAIFIYAFNKALELVSSHNLEGININLEIKNRFIQICNQLNQSHIDLDEFGFKNGIQVDKLTAKLHSSYKNPDTITDNKPAAPITPQEALNELSNLNTEIEDSTLDTKIKNIFSGFINSISQFIDKKTNKKPEE
jgi:hypothetical protein